MDTLSDYLRNGTEVWANCEALRCAHGAPVDLQALLDHPRVGDVKPMPTADIAAKAKGYTVLIECWK
ncbi:MAG: hypothetical protein O3A51_06090 [Verrucomicrobia bacterium]|nr:hypothetical protein [Verrucomicrobiota bacterium]